MPRPESPSAGSRELEACLERHLLLRVGMNRGTGGALGSIFRDGTFEYVPIPEAAPTRCFLTYATLPGRHVPSLAAVFPARVAKRHPHIDPDFRTATAMRRRESGGHTKAAIRHGATAEELMEAVWIVAEMRGGGAYAHAALALDTITEEKQPG